MHHVFLIPGFFGFSNLGDVHYFRAVRETLERNFAERGEQVIIHGVKTFPTGSLKRRARRVLETIAESGCRCRSTCRTRRRGVESQERHP